MLSNLLICSLIFLSRIMEPGSSAELCSEAEIKAATEKHNNCLSAMKNNLLQVILQQNIAVKKNNDELCQIINQTVFGCGESNKHCFDKSKINTMKQDQMKIIAELLTKVTKVNPMILNCKEVENFQADEKNECGSATQEYHRCIGEFHITLIDRIKQKLSMITAMEEINNVICEVAKDAIVHCSTILANCIEPTALDEMQNELWNFLQVMMAKKEPFENFKCDQHLINSSMKIPAKVVTNLASVMVLLSLFYY